MQTVTLSEKVLEKREQLAASLRARLGAKEIDISQARDGVRDCFVSTYLGGVEQGLDNLGLKADVDQIVAVTERMLRDRLKQHGASWTQPTMEALDRVKQDLDEELHFDQLPVQLKEVHNNVCDLLLAKAGGVLPHRGDTSVVEAQPPPKQEDPVAQGLRAALIGQLDVMRSAAESGASGDSLYQHSRRLMKLLDTLTDLTDHADLSAT